MKWFKFPFAITGTRTAVPDAIQPSGDVSYEEGYGIDYSRDPDTDPLAKRIERDKYNQILYDITSWIRDLTVIGTPDFITTVQNGGVPYSYDEGARVMFDPGSGRQRYESLVGSNIADPTDATKWRVVGKQGTETILGLFKVASPAQVAAAVDNTVVLTPANVQYITPYKAMVVFDGDGGVSIKKSFNVSSVVRVSAGRYIVSFTNPMADANYPMTITGTANLGGLNGAIWASNASDPPGNKTAGHVEIIFGNGSSRSDVGEASVLVF